MSSGDTKNGCTNAKNHAEHQNTKLYRKNHSTKKIRADKKSAVLHLQGNKKIHEKRKYTGNTDVQTGNNVQREINAE